MRIPFRFVALLGALIASVAIAQESYRPPAGMVPTEETAVAIAVAVFKPIYGADRIDSERPFRASLKSGVWHVNGSLPPGAIGGTAEAEIAQQDGRVLRVWHGQ